MTKNEFTKAVEKWLFDFIEKQDDLELIKIYKSENLSKLNDYNLDGTSKFSNCDFVCDFSALVQLNDGTKDVILVNRYDSSVGLTMIGEMFVYNRIAKPFLSLIISSKGHSSEINNVLLDKKISDRLFCVDGNMYLFSLNEQVVEDSILPVDTRNEFVKRINLF